MKRRFRATVGLIALLAIAVLLLRPALLDATGAPYGAHFSADVQLAYADGSPHCGLLADCETISFNNVGLSLPSGALLVLAGVLMVMTAPRMRSLHSWAVPVPNPPPLLALS